MSQITDIQKILGTTPDGIFAARSQAALACASTSQKIAIQRVLCVPMDGDLGPVTMGALNALINLPAVLKGGWPFSVRRVGNDLCVDGIIITSFGGGFDPQDDGSTASGVSTLGDGVFGVSVAMRGEDFLHLSLAEHAALDGAPIPRLPFGTLVEITIGAVTYTPALGIIDLVPGHQATTDPHDPHALDVTPDVGEIFAPGMSISRISSDFFMRGSFKILGGAIQK